MRIGVVGYGRGGRWFHTPFIEAADGIELAGVVARSSVRADQVRGDWPGVPVFGSLRELLASGVDAVTITTPPETHRELALEAIDAGVHVVVDKPFMPSAEIARQVASAASSAGVLLTVYQNRRWDADIRTLAALLGEGRIGEPWRVLSRFDQDDLASLGSGPGNGLLLDLGTHLVDQMIWLLGPVVSVNAHLYSIEFPEGPTDAAFALDLVHVGGVTSYVESTKAHHFSSRELRAYGTGGSYSARGTDVQANAVMAGLRPSQDKASWGFEQPEFWGTLTTATGQEQVLSEQGCWQDFYSQFAAAVAGEAPVPVSLADAIHTLDVIDAARKSACTGHTVALSEPSSSRVR